MPSTVDQRPATVEADGPGVRVALARILHRSARHGVLAAPGRLAERAGLAPGRRTVVLAGVVAAAALIGWLSVRAFGRPYDFFDMRIYHGAMVWWAGGGELYEYMAPDINLGFTYPPFAALLMLPIAVFSSATVAGWVNLIGGLTALTVVLAWLLVPVADRRGWPRWAVLGAALPLAAATEPVRETLGYGQINLLLLLLVCADLVSLRHRHRAAVPQPAPGGGTHPDPAATVQRAAVAGNTLRRLWRAGALAGVGVGLATAIKLTPGLFILYFVVTRQWRAATTAVVTAVAVTAGTAMVAGAETAAYFTGVLWDTGRVGQIDATPNQSLAGLLARLYDSPTTPRLMWLAFSMLVLAVGMSRAATAHREGDELTAFTLVGLTANVVCPISWTHHLVFVVPAVIVLADTALRRRHAARALATRGRLSRGALGRFVPGLAALAGLRHAAAAVGLYTLFVVSPVWRYEHRLPGVSHYADGLFGALAENSFALALIALVALLPWRPGADPAFYADEPRLGARRAAEGITQRG